MTTKISEWTFATYKGDKVLCGRLEEDHAKARNDFIVSMVKGHRVVTSAVQKESFRAEADKLIHTVQTRYTVYELIGPSRGETAQDMVDEGKFFWVGRNRGGHK